MIEGVQKPIQLFTAFPGNNVKWPCFFLCCFLSILTVWPWFLDFFFLSKECFTTYCHKYFFCEALHSARHRFGPSIILQDCWKNLGRCNPLLDKTTQRRKQMRTIKYWRWQYSAACNYLNNNILLLVWSSSKPGREWSNNFECWLTVLVWKCVCLQVH